MRMPSTRIVKSATTCPMPHVRKGSRGGAERGKVSKVGPDALLGRGPAPFPSKGSGARGGACMRTVVSLWVGASANQDAGENEGADRVVHSEVLLDVAHAPVESVHCRAGRQRSSAASNGDKKVVRQRWPSVERMPEG